MECYCVGSFKRVQDTPCLVNTYWPSVSNKGRKFLGQLSKKRTDLLTAWSRFLLEKLTGSQIVKKCPAFYGTRKFNNTLTRAFQLSVSRARSIKPMLRHPTSWRSILTYSSVYAWVFQVVSFPQVSPPNPCMLLFSPSYVVPSPPISFFSIWSPNNILWWYRPVSSSVCSFTPLTLYLVPLRPQIFSSATYSQTPSTYILPSMRATNLHTLTKQQAYFYLYILFFG